jgi:hypothetical protein
MKFTPHKWLMPCLLLVIKIASLSAQTEDRSNKADSVWYDFNLRSVLGTGNYAPFLTVANQYDRHSIQPNQLSLWSSVHQPVSHAARFDYGYGIELDAQVAKNVHQVFPGELYLEGKGGPFLLIAGRKHAVYGNQDPQLSSGGLIWSRNSRPIQRVSIETDGYVTVPFTRGLREVQGGLTHGWLPTVRGRLTPCCITSMPASDWLVIGRFG